MTWFLLMLTNYWFCLYYSSICTAYFHFVQQTNIQSSRDFDAFDLRLRLPAVVSKLYKAIYRNGGVTYIHCTAGLGRAPAVAVCFSVLSLKYELILPNIF